MSNYKQKTDDSHRGMPALVGTNLPALEKVRVPPHNYEAEQALLGSLLHNNQALEKVNEFLRADHFADPVHTRIYEAIVHLISRGHIADPITLKDYFAQDEALADVGGSDYLVHLAAEVVSIVNVGDYGRQIHDLYLRRQLVGIGSDVVNDAFAFSLNEEAASQIEQAERKLFNLALEGQADRGFIPFHSSLSSAIKTAENAFKRDSKVVGVTTGLADMDRQLGGLHPSDLLILAGRPSMGKTALATNIAFNSALSHLKNKDGAKVAFFSLEMSSEQLAMRLLGQETGISSDRIRRGEFSHSEFQRFIEASKTLSNLPLFIDDTPSLTVGALRTRARRLKRQEGLGLIVIDYLQLLRGDARHAENRVQEISEITRSLKALAKELEVPVIALSQLSRAVEQRDDKRPQLSDLRESGSIEQDADVVMFVFREEYYHVRKQPPPGTDKFEQWQREMARIYNVAEIIIAKQRHGPVGTIRLHFEGELTKFSNLMNDPQVTYASNE